MSLQLQPESTAKAEPDQQVIPDPKYASPSSPDFDYTIVLYNEAIYVVGKQHEHSDFSLHWGADYFSWKTAGGTYNALFKNALFSVDPNEKLMRYYRTLYTTTMSEEEAYLHYTVKKKDIKESDVYTIHTTMLKARIVRKLLDTPSKEQLLAREHTHRSLIKQKIEEMLLEISGTLYATAAKGKQAVHLAFETINETHITDFKKYPRYERGQCADGKIRESFSEYVYYLCEQIFERHADETDPKMWIGARLAERVRALYPHLVVQVFAEKYIFPRIEIQMNIDVSNLMH